MDNCFISQTLKKTKMKPSSYQKSPPYSGSRRMHSPNRNQSLTKNKNYNQDDLIELFRHNITTAKKSPKQKIKKKVVRKKALSPRRSLSPRSRKKRLRSPRRSMSPSGNMSPRRGMSPNRRRMQSPQTTSRETTNREVEVLQRLLSGDVSSDDEYGDDMVQKIKYQQMIKQQQDDMYRDLKQYALFTDEEEALFEQNQIPIKRSTPRITKTQLPKYVTLSSIEQQNVSPIKSLYKKSPKTSRTVDMNSPEKPSYTPRTSREKPSYTPRNSRDVSNERISRILKTTTSPEDIELMDSLRSLNQVVSSAEAQVKTVKSPTLTYADTIQSRSPPVVVVPAHEKYLSKHPNFSSPKKRRSTPTVLSYDADSMKYLEQTEKLISRKKTSKVSSQKDINNLVNRLSKPHKKKMEVIDKIKKEEAKKLAEDCSFNPKTNISKSKRDSFKPFHDRQDALLNRRRVSVARQIRDHETLESGFSYQPKINRKSKNLERDFYHLLQWGNEVKFKQDAIRRQENDEGPSFSPELCKNSIKMASRKKVQQRRGDRTSPYGHTSPK